MNSTAKTGIVLTFMALVFTIGLTFASAELPALLDKFVGRHFNFPNVATGQDSMTDWREQLYVSRYHIRLIGYICFALVVGLIAAGFILEKKGLASAGALVLFLPVFGHFAATMFFLGGLAFLRFLWLPFLDISFDVMSLGSVALLPYDWLLKLFEMIGINLWNELPFIITGLGLLIFLLGVIAWMQGRVEKRAVTDFWIYRLSRHPQYLGWIIWSYGVMFLPGANMKRYVDVPNSLAWLLTAMIIIAIAMMEERRMKRDHGAAYDAFRAQSPFLFPLPRIVRRFFSLPLRLAFKRQYPETRGQIAAVTGFYTVLLIIISLFSGGLLRSGSPAAAALSPEKITSRMHTMRTSGNRGDIREAAGRLSRGGDAAVDSLITLMDHGNVFVRWYGADALGVSGSFKAVDPLIALLDDPDRNVRRTAAEALGNLGFPEAEQPLLDVFLNPERDVDDSSVARALARLGSPNAVPALLRGLRADHPNTRRWSAWALGELGAKEAIEPVIAWFETDSTCDCAEAGRVLLKLGSDRAEDAFSKGLKAGQWWVVQGCVRSLAEIPAESALDKVIAALDHENEQVRRTAVLVLGNRPSEKSRAALTKALKDSDFEVRMYAEELLKEYKR
ncbi:HEAT repeat domain-containing protein [bacterium]|nr:HEAT repeat domain-containing protein [bacterium]